MRRGCPPLPAVPSYSCTSPLNVHVRRRRAIPCSNAGYQWSIFRRIVIFNEREAGSDIPAPHFSEPTRWRRSA
jgi:hypothetical protein